MKIQSILLVAALFASCPACGDVSEREAVEAGLCIVQGSVVEHGPQAADLFVHGGGLVAALEQVLPPSLDLGRAQGSQLHGRAEKVDRVLAVDRCGALPGEPLPADPH